MTLAKEVALKGIKALDAVPIKDVVQLIRDANNAYYNLGKPLLTDDLYDVVKDYLTQKDPQNPVLEEVGAVIEGAKVTLPEYMGSLDKIRDDPKALISWKKKYPGEVVVSDKLDGNSALYYIDKKGKASLYSRGNGVQGQDVSKLLSYLNLPVPDKALFPLAVRGEMIISKADWKPIAHKGANARNSVAGVMHAKHPDPEISKQVSFVAYEFLRPSQETPLQGFQKLKELGFKVAEFKTFTEDQLTTEGLSDYLLKRRDLSPYEVDGIVIEHNVHHKRIKGQNPKYAFAFKTLLTHEEAEVIIKEVEWNASKDGYLKPTVHFDPVTLSGASIRKATGFNAGFIRDNNIGPGSRIVIIRSGDVIPHIVRVLTQAKAALPTDIEYVWNETNVDILLKNPEENSQTMLRIMSHFASTLQMKGLAEGLLKKMYDQANIKTLNALVHLKRSQIESVEGFKDKTIDNILQAIQGGLERASCVDLMVASNLFGRGMGSRKLQSIADKFPEILEGKLPSYEALIAHEGLGPATVKQFIETYPRFLEFLKETGLQCKKPVPKSVSLSSGKKSVDGLSIIFTGFRNKEWEGRITAAHGKISTSVSKKTNLVIAKDPAEESAKLIQARANGIPILTPEQFEKEYAF
jgi:NAD-dependent DNA ligase